MLVCTYGVTSLKVIKALSESVIIPKCQQLETLT